MALPGYAADASLYRTRQSYRGAYSGPIGADGRTVLSQQVDCNTLCAIKWQVCNIGCATSSGPLVFLCLAACGAAFGLCLNGCPSGGNGGGGGGTPPECGLGRRCCERDENGRCTICIPNNASCP